jgi:hypothetical protein
MTKEQIAEACARAGLPEPVFGRQYAMIRIRIGPAGGRPSKVEARSFDLPDVNRWQFDRWCGPLGHAATARFINAQLGTRYTINDVYHMRRRDKTVWSSIRRLVRDFPAGPVDPKPRKGTTP